jgi:hypothetical protein
MKRVWFTLGLVTLGSTLAVGCGTAVSEGGPDNNSTSSSSSSSSSASSSSGESSSSSSSSGSSGSSSSSSSSGNSSSSSSSSSSGGSNYATCDECTGQTGASANECQDLLTACLEWKTCNSLMFCNDMGNGGGVGGCDKTTVEGGCCSLKCDASMPDPEGVARYRALDACIHCKTCANLCPTSTKYCAVFEPDGTALCKP